MERKNLAQLEHIRRMIEEKHHRCPARDGDETLLQACEDDYKAILELLKSPQGRVASTTRKAKVIRSIGDSSLLQDLDAIDRLTMHAMASCTMTKIVKTDSIMSKMAAGCLMPPVPVEINGPGVSLEGHSAISAPFQATVQSRRLTRCDIRV